MRKIPFLATIVSFGSLTLACTLPGCGGDDNGGQSSPDSGAETGSAADDAGNAGEPDAVVLGDDDATPPGDDDASQPPPGDDDDVDAAPPGDDDASDGSVGVVDASDGASPVDAGVDAHDGASPVADAGVDATVDAGQLDASDAGGSPSDDAGLDASDAAVDAADAALPVDAGPLPTVFVLRVGDGTTTPSNASIVTFLDEYPIASGATPIRSIALPTTASGSNNPITLSGTATSEGQLELSANGKYVTFAGFSAPPGVTAIASTTSIATTDGGAFYPRVVARVDVGANIDTSTLLPGLFNDSDIRSAVSTDGTAFWVAGVDGVEYAAEGANGAQAPVVTSPSNVRGVNILSGQLYLSSGSSPFVGVSIVGTGVPTSAATATLLPGFTTDADGGDASVAAAVSPYAFVGFDTDATAGIDVLYVADTPNSGTGGVQKWTFDGTTWTKFSETALGTKGVIGLTGFTTLGVATLVATTTENPARLVAFVDDGTSAPIVIASSPTKTFFRGVALAPSL